MQAFHLGTEEKSLGLLPEEEHGGMARQCSVQQVEMGQCLVHGSLGAKGISASAPGALQKIGQFLLR